MQHAQGGRPSSPLLMRGDCESRRQLAQNKRFDGDMQAILVLTCIDEKAITTASCTTKQKHTFNIGVFSMYLTIYSALGAVPSNVDLSCVILAMSTWTFLKGPIHHVHCHMFRIQHMLFNRRCILGYGNRKQTQ